MDLREKLYKHIENEIALFLSPEDTKRVSGVVLSALTEYEVSERVTDVVVRPTLNDNILNTYRGCLVIDGKSEKTINSYILTLSKFALYCRKSLLEVSAYDIRLYLAEKIKMGNSDASVGTQRAHISAFYSWLYDNGHIEKNPCSPIKPTKTKKEIKFPFAKEDIDSLRNACKNDRDRTIIEFLLSTGVRVSELTTIEVKDINFSNKSVHIVHGKGKKERITYFNDSTAEWLHRYMDKYRIVDGTLFKGKRGNMTKNGIEALLNRLADSCGVENVHPHRFRRTFATEMSKNGCPVVEIQKLLGHSSLNTTMQYIALCDESTKLAYETYEAFAS